MRTLTHLAAIAAMLCISSVLSAQAAAPPATRPAPAERQDPVARLDDLQRWMADQLGLTDDQKQKLSGIFEQARQELQKMVEQFRQDQLPPAQRLEKIRTWMDGVRQNVENVLSDEQKQKLAERLSALREVGGRVFEQMQVAIEKLQLSDEQRAKIKDTVAAARQKLREARAEARKSGDWRATADRLRGILDEVREQARSILTPEQQKQLQDQVEEFRGQPATRP